MKAEELYVAKLDELGVYDKYIFNLHLSHSGKIPITATSFEDFISKSFIWVCTPEGNDFWLQISITEIEEPMYAVKCKINDGTWRTRYEGALVYCREYEESLIKSGMECKIEIKEKQP